jgi:hypothetical protein
LGDSGNLQIVEYPQTYSAVWPWLETTPGNELCLPS